MASTGNSEEVSVSKFFQPQNSKKRLRKEISQVSSRSEPSFTRNQTADQSASLVEPVEVYSPSPKNSTPIESASVVLKTRSTAQNHKLDAPSNDGVPHGATQELDSPTEDESSDLTVPSLGLVSPQQRNPFLQFAFSSKSAQNTTKTAWKKKDNERSSKNGLKAVLRHGQRLPSGEKASSKSKSSSSCEDSDSNTHKKEKSGWVRMSDLGSEEQERIKRKWQSLADPDAPLEVRRFQVLVAARLHARCQEPVVRKTMKALSDVFEAIDESQGLCASAVSQADPEVLANVISSVQYYNVKAKHIVKSSQEIQSRFGGEVPESENSLKQLTGIRPVMADLLAYVNNRGAYKKSAE